MWNLKRKIGLIAGAALIILFVFLPAPQSLVLQANAAGANPVNAMRMLGVLAGVIIWWIMGVFPDWIGSMFLALFSVILAKLPFSTAFSAISGTAIWIIIGSFIITSAATKYGLFKRISLMLMTVFPSTYNGQVLALLVTGAIFTPLIPSSTAKAVLGASIAYDLANEMGFEKGSHRRIGIFLASVFGFYTSSTLVMTGSVNNVAMYDTMNSILGYSISWTKWFITMLPWFVIYLVFCYIFLVFYGRKDEGTPLPKDYAKNALKEMGAFSKNGKIVSLILCGTIIFWILESLTGINSATVATIGGVLIFVTGVLDYKELSTAVPWDFVLFLTGVLSMPKGLSSLGLDVWLSSLMSGFVSSIGTPVGLLIIIAVISLVLRIAIPSQGTAVALLYTLMASFISALGVNPFLAGAVMMISVQIWFLPYQNVCFMPALKCMKDSLSFKKMPLFSAFYVIAALLAFFLCIPYFRLLSLI